MTIRRRGLSVRAKLTLSYTAFLLVAWVAFLLVLGFVLQFVPDTNLVTAEEQSFAPGRSDLVREAVPVVVAGTAALSAIGLLGGWILAGRMLGPLSVISAAATRAAGGSLSHRINLSGPDDELRQLADVFDEMLIRLERSFEEQQRFAANASHELRTPHAVMRTMLEVAALDPAPDVNKLVGRLVEMNNRSIATIEALLLLARTAHTPLTLVVCDLADVVEDVVDELASATAYDVTVDMHVQSALVLGDRVLLRQLVTNLLKNAIEHSGADGLVRVSTAGTRLSVENSGRVLAREVVATLVEPFVRGAGRLSRTGSGLGLSVVASIARAHDGALELSARQGGGLIVTLDLPAPDPPAATLTCAPS